jgi:hypothetical protein
VLGKFSENSAAHKMYLDSIDQQKQLNISFVADKFKGLMQRQQILIESAVDSKKLILEQSGQLVADRMKFLESQIKDNTTQYLNAPEKQKSLPSAN